MKVPSTPPKKMSLKDALRFLLKSHYLGEDFPPLITTEKFAGFCVKNFDSLVPDKTLLERTTLYGLFSAPRTTNSRRVMALPHPSSQLALSLIIAENRGEVRKTIRTSKITLYNVSPEKSAERVFVGLDFEQRTKKEAEILARYPIIMKADVQNFFHTIYTHSLPWAVLGKNYVKDTREGRDKVEKNKLEQHWASQIDRAIQRGNSRETFGIPVGPDISRIIAEILLSGIHKNSSFAKCLDGHKAYRLVDDFFVGFDDEITARRCQDSLRQALWEYNLYLNDIKTQIIHSSVIFDGGWKYEIERFQLSYKSSDRQRDAVQRLLEITLAHCEAQRDSRPVIFFCRRLLTLNIVPANFLFIRNCMLRVGRDFTICLRFVADFVVMYRADLLDAESFEAFKGWTQLLFAMHAKRGHDFEVTWTLIICGVLGLRVSKAFLSVDEPIESPVVLAILGLLSKKGLLDEKWDDWKINPPPTGSLANGRSWLPYYEAVLRDWTNDPQIKKEIRADALFSKLLDEKVTFLDDSNFSEYIPRLPITTVSAHLKSNTKDRLITRTKTFSGRKISEHYT
ncbi:RNA-directed DNA polymerase [Methylocella silvestris]|uniref:Reverse transcriptase domain-containing protein n=1 Tax=Methylocella silvestris TaxID=199596 RepID=A0A2J7TBT4_METSI|nr:RNA-directed DNA polymerase [Methylocella silvestris]PNG24231.1 hypothetical protein CR492_19785 [Methylocella silvestris]